MNPMEFMKMIKNPREFVISYSRRTNNPMFNNLIEMAENNDIQGLENFARNIYKENGRDIDQDFNAFRNIFHK